MLIPRNNFTHDPPWKYTIVGRMLMAVSVRNPRHHPSAYVDIDGRGTFFLGDTGPVWNNAGPGSRRYKTVQDAMKALDYWKGHPMWHKPRIEHIYYEPLTNQP